jgi:murein DD-endopeptidase MepM/ murein hydrolase activator NlpD
MSKAVVAIIFIFLALVIGNVFLNAAASLLNANSFSYAHAQIDFSGSNAAWTDVSSIHMSLFTKDGVGTSYVTQGYGRTPYSAIYPGDWHDGIDLTASYGEPIYSPNDGIVVAVGNQDNYCYHRAFGKYIAVRDPVQNLILWYAHLGAQTVSPGQTITRGTELGTIGMTGLETGAHLHFSIFEANGFTMTPRDGCGPEPTGQDIDPLNYLGSIYN